VLKPSCEFSNKYNNNKCESNDIIAFASVTEKKETKNLTREKL